MVYKRYIIINGKKYGPYSYESFRGSDGKVHSKYLKPGQSKNKKIRKFLEIFGLLILSILVLIAIFNIPKLGILGNIIISFQEKNFVVNETIKGNLTLILQQGELLPFNTLINIEFANQTKQFTLKQFVELSGLNLKTNIGNFYTTMNNLNGSGVGYGIKGVKEEKPTVYFKINVSPIMTENITKINITKNETFGNITELNITNMTLENITIPTENLTIPIKNITNKTLSKIKLPIENITQKPKNITEIPENITKETEKIVGNITETEKTKEETPQREILEEKPEENIQEIEAPKEEKETEEPEEPSEAPSEKKQEIPTPLEEIPKEVSKEEQGKIKEKQEEIEKSGEKPEAQPEEEKETEKPEAPTEAPSEEEISGERTPQEIQGKESGTPETVMSKITSSVIYRPINIIEGSCTKDREFVLKTRRGYSYILIPGSVRTDKGNLSDDSVLIEFKKGNLYVKTNYSEISEGFGKDFLGNEKEIINLDLSKLNLYSEKQGIYPLKITLSYENKTIMKLSKPIKILNVTNITNHAPRLIKNIPNLKIKKNSSAEINLSNYFYDQDKDVLHYRSESVKNITINFKNSLAKIIPNINFTGSRSLKFYASDGINETESNEFVVNITNISFIEQTSTNPIIINKPVKWTKKIKTFESGEIIIKIPLQAKNISIKKIKGSKNANNLSSNIGDILGKVISSFTILSEISPEINETKENKTNGKNNVSEVPKKLLKEKIISEIEKEIEFPVDENSEYEIIFTTPEPKSYEENLTKYRKKIIISSPLHYTNILAYTSLPIEIPKEKIRGVSLYLIENETYVLDNISLKNKIKKIKKDFNSLDTDNNSLIDTIEWTVPHLSNATYEIDITIINVQSYPKLYGNWTVMFNTTGQANLTITAFNGTTWSNESENFDLKFLEIRCGNITKEYEWFNNSDDGTNNSVFIENFECNFTSKEISKVLTAKKHTLQFKFGTDVEYAYNDVLENIIKNPGFENGASDDNWTTASTADASASDYNTDENHTGLASGSTFTSSPITADSYASLTQTLSSLVSNLNNSFVAWIKYYPGAAIDYFYIHFSSQEGNSLYYWYGRNMPSDTSTEKYINCTDDLSPGSWNQTTRNFYNDWNITKGLPDSDNITEIALYSHGSHEFFSCSGTLDCSVYTDATSCSGCSQCYWNGFFCQTIGSCDACADAGSCDACSLAGCISNYNDYGQDVFWDDLVFNQTINFAPVLDKAEMYPETPTSQDNLIINITCSDQDNDILTAYFDVYKNNVKQDSLSGSKEDIDNGIETTVQTILSGNTTFGEEWYATLWCYDGTENSSKQNTSIRTIASQLHLNSSYDMADVYANDTNNNFATQIRWNISGIPEGITIKRATLCLYWISLGIVDSDSNYSRIDNQTWTELLSAEEFNSQSLTNTTTSETWSGLTPNSYSCLNITPVILTDYNLGNNFSSIRIEDPDFSFNIASEIFDNSGLQIGGVENFLGEDRESSYGRPTPYLNISYLDELAPSVSFVSPTPENGSRQINNEVIINVTINDSSRGNSEISSCILEWNGVNETMTKIGEGSFVICNATKITADGTNYTYRVYANDSFGNLGSSGVRIFRENAKPDPPLLVSPDDGNHTTDRYPLFDWDLALDNDDDPLTYQFNLTCLTTAGGLCSPSDNRLINITNGSTAYKLVEKLKKFGDDGNYYIWSVRSYDNYEYSNFATYRNLTLDSLVSITLPKNSIDFGSLSNGDKKNTTNTAFNPFIIQNDGNCFLNVSIKNSTNLIWSSIQQSSSYYQYKVSDNESGSINLDGSKTSWTNIPTSEEIAINRLNWTNISDTAKVDIFIEVPLTEPPGNKSSTLIFTGSYIMVDET